jgi:hypothetical protein
LLVAYFTSNFWTPHQRETAIVAMIPSAIVLAIAALRIPQMLLLVAVIAELWIPTRDWNPVVSSTWMYPKTPMLRALDDLAKSEKAPFRIVGNAATFFPNVSAIYGYEDVRAHDPMSNGRYIGLISHVAGYDPTEYFARWPDWENPLVDYLNVRYVLTSAGGQLPPRFHQRYDGRMDGSSKIRKCFPASLRCAERHHRLQRRVVREPAEGTSRLGQTALLESLAIESPRSARIFPPRPADAPIATTEMREASSTDYRLPCARRAGR